MFSRCKRDMGCEHKLDFSGVYIVNVSVTQYDHNYHWDTTYVDTLLVTNTTPPYKFSVNKVPTSYKNAILKKAILSFESNTWYPSSKTSTPNKRHNICERFARSVNVNGDVLIIGEDNISYSQQSSGSGGYYFRAQFEGKKN